jgi:hypothetical protein
MITNIIASNFYLHGIIQTQASTCMHQAYQNMASSHLQVVDKLSVATRLETPLKAKKVI